MNDQAPGLNTPPPDLEERGMLDAMMDDLAPSQNRQLGKAETSPSHTAPKMNHQFEASAISKGVKRIMRATGVVTHAPDGIEDKDHFGRPLNPRKLLRHF